MIFSEMKTNGSNGTKFMYAKEDMFAGRVGPLLKMMDAVTEEVAPSVVHFGRVLTGRYIQNTADELAEKRAKEAELAKNAVVPVDPRDKDNFKVTTKASGYPCIQWQDWEVYCLEKFVTQMPPSEAARSLKRSVRAVRQKAYAMGLKWTFTDKRRTKSNAQAIQRAEAAIVAHFN